MKKTVLIMLVAFVAMTAFASDDINGGDERKKVEIGQTFPPMPHLYSVQEPEAYYTISTATIDFTFDAAYYSEYTIHLVGEYVEMDYFVYSPVVYIPVATFGDIVDIYIESEDCGCYFGSLDKSK